MESVSNLLAQGGVPNSYIEGTFLDSKYLNPSYLFEEGVSFFQNFTNLSIGTSVVDIYHGILIFLAMFFITLTCYCFIRMFEIRAKEGAHTSEKISEYARKLREHEKKTQHGGEISSNPRWITTLNYLYSEHEGDWKLAIIEADSMLEELMGQLGFKGETLGERLKSADQGKFRSLPSAWEVHTVRNRIAHEGNSYGISHHEAKRVLAIYEQIFRGYGFI